MSAFNPEVEICRNSSLLVIGVGAQSAAVDWGVHGPIEMGVNVPAMDRFLDTVLFEIAAVPYTVSSTAIANNPGGGAVLHIVGGQYSLWSAGGNGVLGGSDDVKSSADHRFKSTFGDTINSVSLTPGT